MQFVNRLLAIHTKNYPGTYPEFLTGITHFLVDYGFSSDTRIPQWINEMASMILDEKQGVIFFDEVGSDMGSLFQELGTIFGWLIDDSGEEVSMIFPVSRLRVSISREARNPEGRSCASCTITTV